jgi:predicted anti-sigma-YlaC factor YlaD
MSEPTLNHLTDELLFEYLDQALSEEHLAEVKAHLDTCQTCKTRLAEFGSLFSEIEELPEIRMEKDLVPGILHALRKKAMLPPIVRWILLMQGILALGLIAISVPWLGNILVAPNFRQYGEGVLINLTANISIWFREWGALLGTLKQHSEQLFSVRPYLAMNLPAQSLIWLLLLATITWIVGNSILLRSQHKKHEQ